MTVGTDAFVLKHQIIRIHNAALILIVLDLSGEYCRSQQGSGNGLVP